MKEILESESGAAHRSVTVIFNKNKEDKSLNQTQSLQLQQLTEKLKEVLVDSALEDGPAAEVELAFRALSTNSDNLSRLQAVSALVQSLSSMQGLRAELCILLLDIINLIPMPKIESMHYSKAS